MYGFTINNETQKAFYTSWLAMQGYFCFSYYTPLGFSSLNFNLGEIKTTLQKQVNRKQLNEHSSRIKNSPGTFFIGFFFFALSSGGLNRSRDSVYTGAVRNYISLCSFPRRFLFSQGESEWKLRNSSRLFFFFFLSAQTSSCAKDIQRRSHTAGRRWSNMKWTPSDWPDT